MREGVINGYIRLIRPPNLPTAAADILAGLAIATAFADRIPGFQGMGVWLPEILLLILASVLLYAGGVVFNDVFDAELDALERPERPIPSGVVPKGNAALYGGILLVAGVVAASLVRISCGYIAVLLSGAILFYDSYAKRFDLLGPLVMGVCRSLNLWLGLSLFPMDGEGRYLWVPLLYIFAVTAVSRGEVKGNNRNKLLQAALMYGIVIFGLWMVAWQDTGKGWELLPFLGLLAWMVYNPLVRAYRVNEPGNIRAAVKGGVLGIVALDAAWAAGYAGIWAGLITLSLLPVSGLLARRFAVT